ncbi:GlsB/YeaQ/YmgE family stress response membrane protein [Pseudomonas pseudonitroreducens]|uniref:GlsB/YeaQ/YmgE family stress response membrane protein n=1 Tax=Pseudomonas pseudonitroreducens TaxID=2892326 RepID=UPI001F30A5F4|nr:GlsB/YeaQ/YmgE family stress response membrane protein [Pseudomonas pseudonitroreducens]
MHLIWTICIGFVAGLVARWLTPGSSSLGFFITAALGIAGALLATYAGQALHFYESGESAGFIGAVVGAIILLALYHVLFAKKN